ncbi:hypothetical protein V1520DRAFT_347948 [Lipomyces starkeyi]|uniref:5'-3' DNA helicase ZGRF1-like N-terminal domain-containing protein n=1 Tax=Lipomyces starkeyi NRRL Y-11557 TaxID=675824 RepID=A0A1E3PZS6_LIPST|nr:hypothetical protein LIPSTDRAFT_106745 [Lipomyces starkeyi NRRL Y-11557]
MNADVHVYDILWTPQVIQKSKVWYDGTLKLHTFNKRAMLYDTSRVLIDSVFLSKSVLHLGEMLVMERHLVTIENQTSTYTIDVTPVTRTPGSTRKRIDATVSQRQRPPKSQPYSESPAPECRVSGLRAESSDSNNFTVPLSSNSLSNAPRPRHQPIPPENPIDKSAPLHTPIATPILSPSTKWSQDQSPMVAAQYSPALVVPHISQSPQVQGPRVMNLSKIAQSLPQQLAQPYPKLAPTSNKVNTPYRPPTSVLALKSPNIGLSPSSSSRTAIDSNLDLMNVKQRRIPPASCVNKKAKKNLKEPLLTPPDASSPVKTSSVVSDRDIHDDYDPGEFVVEIAMTKNLSSNVKAAVVGGFHESTKLLLQQQMYDAKQFGREPQNGQLSPTFPSLSTTRSVDSPPERAESANLAIRKNKLLPYQSNQGQQSRMHISPSKEPGDNDFGTHAEPEEDYGLNDHVEFGSFSFNKLRGSHSPASEFSMLHNPDKLQSHRPIFAGTKALEAAELTLTQSEPKKRKLLSIPRKPTRRKIVR